MTVRQLALAISFGLLLAAAGAWCLAVAVRTHRPDWRTAPALSVAVWWLGQALGWGLLTVLFGGLAGLAAQAVWRLMSQG